MEKASQDKREKNTNYQPEMHVRNANSREIFKNNRLTSQFLRNYTNIPLLANVMPEDIEDVDADVTANRITTLPRFTDATRWISIENIPVFSGKISILHQSAGSSTFANKSGKELIWRAMFPGNVAMISGMDAKHTNDELGNSFSYLDIVCKPGETKTAEACKYKLEEDEKFD